MNPAIAKHVGLNLGVQVPILHPFDNRAAAVATRDGQIIRTFVTKFTEPLFKNGYVYGTRNSIEFQNVGLTDVIINGNWTIKPGGSKKFSSSDEVNINADRFTVYFPSDPFNTNLENRLEICELILSDMTVAFAKHKGIQING